MAEALKEILNREAVERLADELSGAYDKLDREGFIQDACRGLSPLALLDRANHIAKAMQRHLPADGEEALAVMVRSFGEELPNSSGAGVAVLRYMPHASFISLVGSPHFEASMRAQEALTRRFTAEFCIRHFLVRYPTQTHQQMLAWAKSDNVHLRRLASEGCRPRLPWASRLESYIKDPSSAIEILELLQDDPEEYVRRSVANNINDIAKDHPEVAIALCERWSHGASTDKKRLIQHAMRTLIKRGDKSALALFGASEAPKVALSEISLRPKQLKIGEKMKLSFIVKNTAEAEQTLVLDYVVHFQKANGETRPKVFKLKQLTLQGQQQTECNATLSFQEMTTRKHYPGKHTVEAKINGELFPLGEITLKR